MRPEPCRWRLSGSLCLAAVVTAWSCGGGGAIQDEFPDIKGTYGGLASNTGSSELRWIAGDGSLTSRLCNVMISVTEQSGGSFGGSLQRVPYGSGQPGLCTGQGTIAGEIAKDRGVRFQLLQERWATCTARGPVQYTGTIIDAQIDASGSVALLCDDGSTATVQDHLTAAIPHLPGL
jgi:hypothetical protein